MSRRRSTWAAMARPGSRRKSAREVLLVELEALIPGAAPYAHDTECTTHFTGPEDLRGSIRVHTDARTATMRLDWVPARLARDLAARPADHYKTELANILGTEAANAVTAERAWPAVVGALHRAEENGQYSADALLRATAPHPV